MQYRRPARLVLALSLLAVGFAVPATSSAAPFSFARVAVGSLTAPLTRTFAVPSGAVLAGVTWASGTPSVSALSTSGWEELENDPVELGGRPGTEPYWLDRGAQALTLRFLGKASDVRVDFVGADAPAASSSSGDDKPPTSWQLPHLGKVVTRPGWGANEGWRSGGVSYMTPKALVVHHTVTRNDYTAAEAPGLIRAVYAYHTKSRGWDDIGYNILVDRFGTVYEGRYGGFQRGVIGTHTAGFNSQTLGISLLGNYDEVDTPGAVIAALGRGAKWMHERWGVDARQRVTLTSAGSPRFPRGARVTVSRMPGHRDLGTTACPGGFAYRRLPSIRKLPWRVLPPVFGKPHVQGAPVRAPEQVTVTSELSVRADWKATIATEDGSDILAVATGRGTHVRVRWNGVLSNGLPALPGMSFRFRLTASDRVHGVAEPVAGTFEGGMPNVVP
ncbi:MAG TPA: N-acetylmuramoyl-L-alanine amidase [Frankiaceae bacterium]|nr:N-acetylmuramoyl-L-alanine amidase [Frankiaceae bacterium]